MSTQQRVNLGIIGGGLMGRETAMAIARWGALTDHPVRPVLTAVCDVNPEALAWFDRVDTVTTTTDDYRRLLAADDVDVVYVAVRHDMHEQIYVDTINAGKDLLAEKPFGIDLGAAERIVATAESRPDVFVRCSSEMPFFPGAHAAYQLIRSGSLGTMIEATSQLSHSSDFDRDKPLNWKRQRKFCGDAGVMNDLGMHVCHVPLRLGWIPERVYAVLQDIVRERPGPDGLPARCDAYDNATLLCSVPHDGTEFPLTLHMKRIDPGQKNTWQLRAVGTSGGVAFSTRYPKTLWQMTLSGKEQVWQQVEMGSQSVFPTVTGGIFESGFSDVILQMWAAFFAERAGRLDGRFGCVTPREALESHRIFQAALQSGETRQAAEIGG
jgi:predicted dehydrogenase